MNGGAVGAGLLLGPGLDRPRWRGVVSAYLRRDAALSWSYRLPFFMGIGQSLLSLPFLYFLSRLVGSHVALSATHGSYFSFAVLGTTLLVVFNLTLVSISQRMRTDQTAGTLEILFAMPLRPFAVVLSSAVYQVLYGLASAAVSLLLAVALGMRFHVTAASTAVAVVGLIASVFLFAAVGVAFGAYVLVFKRGETLTSLVVSALTILGGVYYPVSLLRPAALRYVAEALPFTWAVAVMRDSLLDGQLPWLRLAQVVGSAVLALCISAWLFARALNHARRSGMLGQY